MNNLAAELGVEVPVFNAGMCVVAGPKLAAAVTVAGGMGFLGEGLSSPEWVAKNHNEATALCRGGPIGIDFITPFFTAQHLDVVKQIRPAVSVFFYGIPSSQILTEYRKAGLEFWIVVNSLPEAELAVVERPAAIVVQGIEAGGHNRSETSTKALLSEIAPLAHATGSHLIAAGGIHDACTVAEVVSLGAAGVWCGTRFLASLEANAHEGYKSRVLESEATSTVISRAFGPEWPDEPMRVFRNRAVRISEGKDRHPDVEHIGLTLFEDRWLQMPRFSCFLPTRETRGNLDLMALTMGEVSASIKELAPAGDIVRDLAQGFRV